MSTHHRWLEIAIAVADELVEPVSAVFHEWGHGGVLIEEDFTILPEEDGYHRRPDRPVKLTTYLPGDDLAGERVQKIRGALDHLHAIWPLPEMSLRVVDQEDWENAWKEHFPVHRLGRRTIIKPTWREYSAAPDDLIVELDPGLAFGTGLHPTTQSCAELLEEIARPGTVALDLGTGSGILAIQLARLGVRRVDAWEIEETAVRVARENVALNHAGDVIQVRQATLPGSRPPPAGCAIEAPSAAYDLVVANIIANVIIDLAPRIVEAVRPGGDCVVSGIIEERSAEVSERLGAAGLTTQRVIERGDWRTFHLLRPNA